MEPESLTPEFEERAKSVSKGVKVTAVILSLVFFYFFVLPFPLVWIDSETEFFDGDNPIGNVLIYPCLPIAILSEKSDLYENYIEWCADLMGV